MNEQITYTITPIELLQQKGCRTKEKGNWIGVKECPFCHGGNGNQKWTFAVHIEDGNYVCLRTSCNARSNFWNLLKHFGYNPKEYIDNKKKRKKVRRKRFIYGKK